MAAGSRARPALARWTAVAGTAVPLALLAWQWAGEAGALRAAFAADGPGPAGLVEGAWLAHLQVAWIEPLGISFFLAEDGLTMIMLALTFALGLLAVLASWRGITERVGAFHFVLLWTVAGLAGVFLALDLFLFYFFFEMMLIPMYFVIAVWGHERRVYAAIKFFLFTQVSGLLMLVAIVALYFIHGRATGEYTFSLHRAARDRADLGDRLPAHARLLRRLRRQAARVPPAHLAAGRAHRGADGRLRDPRRRAHQGRRLRDDPLHGAAVPGRGRRVPHRRHGAGGGRHHLRRRDGLRADRPQTAGGLHEREPHGLRAARRLRLEHPRPAGRGAAARLPRPLHGRPLHPRRRAAGPHPHARHERDGRPLAGRAAHGRHGDVLRPRLAGATRPGQLRRRVPDPRRRVARERVGGCARGDRSGVRHRLRAVDDAARLPGRGDARLALRRPGGQGDGHVRGDDRRAGPDRLLAAAADRHRAPVGERAREVRGRPARRERRCGAPAAHRRPRDTEARE